MPGFCCVPGCTNRGRPYSFHKFPKDKELFEKWIEAIRRDPGPYFTITEYTRVCSAHFSPDDYKDTLLGERARLKTWAVPSLFNWAKEEERQGQATRSSKTRKIERSVTSNNFKSTKVGTFNLPAIPNVLPNIQSNKQDICRTTNGANDKLSTKLENEKAEQNFIANENPSHDEDLHELLVPEVILEEKETVFSFKENFKYEKGTQAGSGFDTKDVQCQTEKLCNCQNTINC